MNGNNRQQLHRIVIAVICIGLIPGCTTVPVTSNKLAMIQDSDKEKFSGDLPQAIMDVEGLRKKYLDEIVRQSNYREGIADILIPLTAWALYKGVTPSTAATNNMLAKAGIGGAALYGWGNYALSTDRQMIYLAGNDALGCTIAAMRPYLFTKSEFGELPTPEAATFLGERQRLDGAIPAAKKAIEEYENKYLGISSGSRKDDLAQARTDLSSAQEVLSKANRLKADAEMAGAKLRLAAQNIQNQVIIELVKAQPDLASITGITRGLLDSAPQFVGGRTFKMLGTDTSAGAQSKMFSEEQKSQETKDWQTVVASMQDVAEASRALSARLNDRAELSKSVAALETCKFQGPASDFRIAPDIQEIELSGGQSASFSIYGGSGIPRVSLTGVFVKDNKDDVAVVKTQADGGIFQAMVTIKPNPGVGNDLHLDFTDGSGRAKRKVDLKIRTAEKPTSANSDTAAASCKPQSSQYDATAIKGFQKKLGIQTTGKFDLKTCKAIESCAATIPTVAFNPQSISGEVFQKIDAGKCKQPQAAKPAKPAPDSPSTVTSDRAPK